MYRKLIDDIFVKEDYVNLADNDVKFITFNYDRSLEHYLFQSFMNSFSEIKPDEKIKILKKLKIIHIFGQVSGLEWQDENIKYTYGIDPYSVDVERISKGLKIIYEEKEKTKLETKDLENKENSNLEETKDLENNENPKIKEAKDLIKKANRIFFLGFGYAPENLKILDIPNILNIKQNIYGTAFGSFEEEIKKIKPNLDVLIDGKRFENKKIILEDCDCLELLKKYL